jgi:hypothetical protein
VSFLINPFWTAAAPAFTTFNPLDKGASIVLSNGNKTATTPGAIQQGARGTTFKNSGSLHFEFTTGPTITGSFINCGIADPTSVLTAGGTASNSTVTGFSGFVGSRFYHSSGFFSETLTASTTVAIEMNATQIWFFISGSVLRGPFLHGLSSFTPTIKALTASPAGDITLNTGQDPFVVAVQPGFTAFG